MAVGLGVYPHYGQHLGTLYGPHRGVYWHFHQHLHLPHYLVEMQLTPGLRVHWSYGNQRARSGVCRCRLPALCWVGRPCMRLCPSYIIISPTDTDTLTAPILASPASPDGYNSNGQEFSPVSDSDSDADSGVTVSVVSGWSL